MNYEGGDHDDSDIEYDSDINGLDHDDNTSDDERNEYDNIK